MIEWLEKDKNCSVSFLPQFFIEFANLGFLKRQDFHQIVQRFLIDAAMVFFRVADFCCLVFLWRFFTMSVQVFRSLLVQVAHCFYVLLLFFGISFKEFSCYAPLSCGSTWRN